MSVDFALKDISRKWNQSISYIKTILIIIAIPTFIINTLKGMGVILFSESTQLYNYTTFDIFSQYYSVVVYISMINAVLWVLTVNHSLVHHKTRDLAIMKAVGTISTKITGYYFMEIVFIDIIGIILGLLAGFFGYLALFLVMGFVGATITFQVDILLMMITIVLIFILTYIINGVELRILSQKRYRQISGGDMSSNYSAIGGLRLIPKWISKFGLKFKIAVTNLTRKKKQFNRILLTITVALTVLITLATGSILVSNTIVKQIEGAQGHDILLIGHTDLVENYRIRYEEFSNLSLQFNNNEYNFLDSEYLFDEDVVNTLESSVSYQNRGIKYWDKRLFTYTLAYEISGIRIIGQYDEYQVVGKERISYVPVVGLEYKQYIDDWTIFGTINETESPYPCALVGDTLSIQFFEAATFQKISFEGDTTRRYTVTGIFYDSFCAGNATYIPLSSFQNDFYVPSKINMIYLELEPNIDKEGLIQDLTMDIQSLLGSEFTVIDISPTLQQNLDSIQYLIMISWLFIGIFGLIVIMAIINYHYANFREKARDFSIIRAIGGTSKLVKDIIFYEDFMVLLLSMTIAFGVSMNFNLLFLIDQPIIPPFWQFLVVLLLIGIVLTFLVRIITTIEFKNVKLRNNLYLRVFDA